MQGLGGACRSFSGQYVPAPRILTDNFCTELSELNFSRSVVANLGLAVDLLIFEDYLVNLEALFNGDWGKKLSFLQVGGKAHPSPL